MTMKKKGISPLIASVLLIAFTIILFGLITVWMRRAAIEPSMSQTEEKIASELECSGKVMKIISVCRNTGATQNVKTVIDNLGETDLYGAKIRVIGSTGTALGDFPSLNLVPLSRSSSLTVDATGKGTITSVEVYPTTSKGTCEGQLVTTTTIVASATC